MGWEAALSTIGDVVGSFVKSREEVSNARKQSDAVIQEGNLASKNKAREIAYKTGAQRVSFLNAGLTLEGTPTNVIDQTYQTGLEDLDQIASNANRKSSTIMSEARTKAISGLASSFSGFSLPGGGGDSGSSLNENAAFTLNKMGFGNTAYKMLDGT